MTQAPDHYTSPNFVDGEPRKDGERHEQYGTSPWMISRKPFWPDLDNHYRPTSSDKSGDLAQGHTQQATAVGQQHRTLARIGLSG